eukprot:gene53879-40228_t
MAVHSTFTISIRATDPVNQATSRTVLAQVINNVFKRMDTAATGSEADYVASQEDAAWVFGYLCRNVQDTAITQDTHADHSSVRFVTSGLKSILSLLRAGGPGLKEAVFLQQVRGPLLTTLVRCFTAPLPSVFGLSLDIFVELVVHYKHKLKSETGGLFTGAVLGVLRSPHADETMDTLSSV